MYSNEHLMFDQDQMYYQQMQAPLPAHGLASHTQSLQQNQQQNQQQHTQHQQSHLFQQPMQSQLQQGTYDYRHMAAPATNSFYSQQQQQQQPQQQQQIDPLYSIPYHNPPASGIDSYNTAQQQQQQPYYSLPYIANSSTASSASSNNTVTTTDNHGSISSSNSMPTSLYQQAPSSPSNNSYNQQYSYKPTLQPRNSFSNYQQLQTNYLLQPSILTSDSIKRKVSSSDSNEVEYPKFNKDSNPKRSKIAGIIYNSSAVNKRLSPINSKVSKSSRVNNKSQGRPFNNNLNSRLLLHLNIKTLMTHVDKRNENEFIVYDWASPIINSSPIKVRQSLLNLLSDENDLMSEDFRIDLPNASDIDNLLQFKHSGVLKIKGYKENFDPLISNVKYEAKNWTKFDELELNKKLRQVNLNFIDELINSSTNVTSDLLLNDGNEIINDMSNSYNSNNNGIINFHKLVVAAFGVDDYVFVKIIRDNNGHILKLETIKPPLNKNGIYEYTPQWVKRFVCYPRYKSGMNLHLLRQNHDDFILYNNFKMLIWDLKQGIGAGDEYGNKTFTDTVKANLFANKKVYINILKT